MALPKKVNIDDINKYVLGQKAKNTVLKETTVLNRFKKFCVSINEKREIHEIPADDLDNIRCQSVFYEGAQGWGSIFSFVAIG